MKYNEDAIDRLYEENLTEARRLLSTLRVVEGRRPSIGGLNGWVYEQTIRYCLLEELMERGQCPTIKEQVSLEGRVKIDLLVGHVAVEVKRAGSFGDDDRKYSSYRARVEGKGWLYFYLTRGETYKPYRLATTSVFGNQHAFFLDTKGDWQRFIEAVADNCEEKT
jgi:hypothetical protein